MQVICRMHSTAIYGATSEEYGIRGRLEADLAAGLLEHPHLKRIYNMGESDTSRDLAHFRPSKLHQCISTGRCHFTETI